MTGCVEVCNHCGRDVSMGSGWFVNRIPDFNDLETRMANGLRYPRGDFVCAECDLRKDDEPTDCTHNAPNLRATHGGTL